MSGTSKYKTATPHSCTHLTNLLTTNLRQHDALPAARVADHHATTAAVVARARLHAIRYGAVRRAIRESHGQHAHSSPYEGLRLCLLRLCLLRLCLLSLLRLRVVGQP